MPNPLYPDTLPPFVAGKGSKCPANWDHWTPRGPHHILISIWILTKFPKAIIPNLSSRLSEETLSSGHLISLKTHPSSLIHSLNPLECAFYNPHAHLPFQAPAPPHTYDSIETPVWKAFKDLPTVFPIAFYSAFVFPDLQETCHRADHLFLKLCSSRASVTLDSPNILPFPSPFTKGSSSSFPLQNLCFPRSV